MTYNCAICISNLQNRLLLPYLKQTRNIYLQKNYLKHLLQRTNKKPTEVKHSTNNDESENIIHECYKFEQIKIKINNTGDELQMRHKAQDLHNMNNATNVQHM